MFVEAKYFDEEKEAAEQRAEKRREASARKAAEKETRKRKHGKSSTEQERTSCNKRPRTNSTATNPDSDVSPRTRGSGSSSSASPGMDPLAELSEYERIRVEYQQSVQAQRAAAHMKKKGKLEVSAVLPPEVDAVVNAATRQFKCYRKPIAAFYENDRIGENII